MDRITRAILLVLIGAAAVAAAGSARASSSSELFLAVDPGPPVPAEFTATVMLRLREPLTGIGARLRYDPQLLDVVEAYPAPGTRVLWAASPRLTEPDTVEFSGVFPGGLDPAVNSQIPLVVVRFRARADGVARFSFHTVEGYRAEPLAPPAPMTALAAAIPVSRAAPARPGADEDRVAPEPFELLIVREPELAGGAWAAIFQPSDKQGRIVATEIRERFLGLQGSWRQAESPFVLSDQRRLSIIEVRVTDAAGNIRIQRATLDRLRVVWLSSGIVLVALVLLIMRALWARFRTAS